MTSFRRLPEALKWLRVKRGMSREELAEKTGLSLGSIRNYELGANRPSLEALEQVLTVLRVSLEDLGRVIRAHEAGQEVAMEIAEAPSHYYSEPEVERLLGRAVRELVEGRGSESKRPGPDT